MIWIEEIRKLDAYHFFAMFAIFSMLGWLVESIYMSICNRKLTNRGFGRGPFCPIYGCGCVFGYLFFAPFKGNYVFIYIFGCIVATTFEYVVGCLMIKFLGELWWDYKDKPFNYKGMLCLESTLAWGLYALIVVHFLYDFVYRGVDLLDKRVGLVLVVLVYLIFFVDYLTQLIQIFGWPKMLGGSGLKEKPDVGRAALVNHPDSFVKDDE